MNDESRPKAAHETTTKKSSTSIPPTNDSTVLDTLNDDFMTGYLSGFTAGIEHGRELAEQEIATLQRCAAEVVHGLAGIAPWPEQVERARKAQQESVERFRRAVAR